MPSSSLFRSGLIRRLLLLGLLAVGLAAGQNLRFAVIGDSGTGGSGQLAIARQMEIWHEKRGWEFVLMLGDNIYGRGDPRDFDRKFKNVYQKLMQDGVRFHATLGNHDVVHSRSENGMAQVRDEAFGYVGGRDEYVFEAGPEIEGRVLARFICLNSVAWLEDLRRGRVPESRMAQLREWLGQSGRYHWNILYFHHPLYSYAGSGALAWVIRRRGHGPVENLRRILEPEIEGRVDAVLSGHEHFYQKIRPQRGIHYFVSGGGGKVRRGALARHPEVEFTVEALHFMDFEMTPTELRYQAISRSGEVFHRGTIQRPMKPLEEGRPLAARTTGP
jgi:hypothetical protein